jgi:hypothetical protein
MIVSMSGPAVCTVVCTVVTLQVCFRGRVSLSVGTVAHDLLKY